MLTESKVHRCADTTPGAWDAFINAMHSGEVFECDEEMFFYWLGVLPPVWMGRYVHWPDPDNVYRVITVRATFGFAEGIEPITAFWQSEGRYFGRRTSQLNHS